MMPPARPHDWAARLQAVADSYDKAAFQWGQSDCVCFAADCLIAVSGVDILRPPRGLYGSRLTAAARLRGMGFRSVTEFAAARLTEAGAVPAPPEFAGFGDVGVTADNVMCVRFSAGFVARTEQGRFALAKPVSAWVFEWPNC